MDALLTVGNTFQIRTLDPSSSIEATSLSVLHAAYDSLVTFEGEDLSMPKPSLASAWKISGDGRTFTFAIRPNVRFASGNELTSADVKWTLERVMNLKATTLYFVQGIEEVQAPDPRTVVIRTKAPQPSLLPILAGPSLGILDSRLLMEHGGDASAEASTKDRAEAFLQTRSAGTGAFAIASYMPGQELVLTRNPNHWRGPAKIGRVIFRNIQEPAVQALQLVRGDLDVALNLSQDHAVRMQRMTSTTARFSSQAAIFFVQMNTNPEVGGPFSNPKVQQAVRYALDYEGILAVAGPGAQPLSGLMPTVFPGALEPRFPYATDRNRARALLREAGAGEISGRMSHYQATLSGVEVTLLAQKIQADLAAVGIRVELNSLPPPLAVQEWRAGKTQIGVFRWVADYPDPSNYLIFLPGGNVGLRVQWQANASPVAQELIRMGDAAESELDPRRRAGNYQRLERRLVEVGPFIPLFQPTVPYAYRTNLHGVNYHSVWAVDYYPVSKA